MEKRQLIVERDYLTDRLTEISQDLKRLMAEGDILKMELDALSDSDVDRRRAIRRRRTYIGRRSEQLKAERERAVVWRSVFEEQLGGESASRSPHQAEVGSPSSGSPKVHTLRVVWNRTGATTGNRP